MIIFIIITYLYSHHYLQSCLNHYYLFKTDSSGLDKIVNNDENINTIRQVATLAANSDKIIGNLIAKAYSTVGLDGSIHVRTQNFNTQSSMGLKI